ncbi:hypothetical protein DSBG_1718 [Desulfosporosinus sp. BG]|nr:hypothetical protein DSBG_1718 [Desulfosporosinus sp. BG]
MPLDGYHGPYFINDITHPVTLIAFLIVILLGGWVTICTWF